MKYNLFASRTFWTVAAMFVIGGVNAVMPFIPEQLQAVAMALLSLMAAYFHVNPSQAYPRK